jgi:blue light- and temperature-responsive anti-repressor
MVFPPALAGRILPVVTAAAPQFSYAFQPIVDVVAREVFSYEALIRGPANEPAFEVLKRVPADGKYPFDRDCRVVAIELASKLGLNCHLNLNFLPQGLYVSAASIGSTLQAAERNNLPVERIILEVIEGEVIADHAHFARLLNEFRGMGLKVAIDDFGAGYSGLNLLAEFQPDQVKIDMNLVRRIETHGPRQSIVRAVAQVCRDLGIDLVAEGVETVQEYSWLAEQGIRLFQGYLFAKPGFEIFPAVRYPALV